MDPDKQKQYRFSQGGVGERTNGKGNSCRQKIEDREQKIAEQCPLRERKNVVRNEHSGISSSSKKAMESGDKKNGAGTTLDRRGADGPA